MFRCTCHSSFLTMQTCFDKKFEAVILWCWGSYITGHTCKHMHNLTYIWFKLPTKAHCFCYFFAVLDGTTFSIQKFPNILIWFTLWNRPSIFRLIITYTDILTGCSQTRCVWTEKKCVQVLSSVSMRTGSEGAEPMSGGLYKHNVNTQNTARYFSVNMTDTLRVFCKKDHQTFQAADSWNNCQNNKYIKKIKCNHQSYSA